MSRMQINYRQAKTTCLGLGEGSGDAVAVGAEVPSAEVAVPPLHHVIIL